MAKIQYGNGIREPKTWYTTSLHFDNNLQAIFFILERGETVNCIKVTINEAMSLGIINVSPLEKIFKKGE
jgi:hypothetical protein